MHISLIGKKLKNKQNLSRSAKTFFAITILHSLSLCQSTIHSAVWFILFILVRFPSLLYYSSTPLFSTINLLLVHILRSPDSLPLTLYQVCHSKLKVISFSESFLTLFVLIRYVFMYRHITCLHLHSCVYVQVLQQHSYKFYRHTNMEKAGVTELAALVRSLDSPTLMYICATVM